MHIVLADDSPIIRNYLKGVLLRAGHVVDGCANDGPAALEMCRLYRPDLVILDVSMPGMTGDIVAQHIVAESLVPRIIVASSNTQQTIIDRVESFGAKVVGKPFQPPKLFEAIASFGG